MSSPHPVNPFSICSIPGAPTSVRQIPMTAQASDRVASIIDENADQFLSEKLEWVPFDPTYTTDDDSVLWISGFSLPEHIQEAVDAPRSIPSFKKDESVTRVKAMFYVGTNGAIYFQCWRNVEVLARDRIWLLLNGATFDATETSSVPLVISRRLDAVYMNGDLFFRNYGNTSSVLDLMEYVSEATSDDVEAFVNMPAFCGDAAALNAKCSKLHRRQIRSMVKSNQLEEHTFATLREKADGLGYDLPMKDDKIQIPPGGKELSTLLHFLNERIYRGQLTGRTFLANSARLRPSS